MSDELNSTLRERALYFDNELLYAKVAKLEAERDDLKAYVAHYTEITGELRSQNFRLAEESLRLREALRQITELRQTTREHYTSAHLLVEAHAIARKALEPHGDD